MSVLSHHVKPFVCQKVIKRMHEKDFVAILQETMLLGILILEQCFRYFMFCSPLTASVRVPLCLWSSRTALALFPISPTT